MSSGELDARLIRERLAQLASPIDQATAVLDLGCGCGRVLRHWKGVEGTRFYGSDYDPRLTDWCRDNLPFATVITNGSEPPLAFEPDSFDVIYAISLFTHLAEGTQERWMSEVTRVLKPGGVILFTTHGEVFTNHLTPGELDAYRQGRLILHNRDVSGMEACAAFHPPAYVAEQLLPGAGLEPVAAVPGDWPPTGDWSPMVLQDKHLARPPP